MKCILCKHLNLQADVPMAKLGLGKCRVDSQRAHSVSFRFERVCNDFEQVGEQVTVERVTWSENNLLARQLRS
ncbi:hypothetical protein [Collimonas humicola]|uniref:hypothetical protein n=1 Tax=Collimonas humicola TaxID=2825886 RepID=UPI001B8B06C4|nr:hypothetical protein [Collimonas humicola]